MLTGPFNSNPIHLFPSWSHIMTIIAGSGQFGSVCKGLCTLRSGQKVPVAIKTLKKENLDTTKEVSYKLR